jgi:hypothetical protein
MSIIMLKMIAKMMPIENHLERAQDEILEYKLVPTKEKKNSLMSTLMILMAALQEEDKSLEDVMKSAVDDERKMSAVKNMFDANTN